VLDVWVCGSCHSINRERAERCYKCGAPRSEATGQGAGLRQERAIQARLVAPVRNTFPLAAVAIVFILGLAGFELATSAIEIQLAPQARAAIESALGGGELDTASLDAFAAGLDTYSLATLLCFLAGWLALAAWLSLSVSTIPGLGGGEPPIDPIRAFAYTLIPGYTFRHVPRIIQALLYRLDSRAGGVLVAMLAWLGLFGAFVVSYLAGVLIDIRLQSDAFSADSVDEFIQSAKGLLDGAVIVDVVTSGMIVVGALALAATILRIENRRAAREREIEEAVGTA
jgi:hypothetical protein